MPTTEPCPFCGKAIKVTAIRCRFCGEYLDEDDDPGAEDRSHDSGDEAIKWLVPVGRSPWAIIAGYAGLLSCFPFIGLLFGILAVVLGVISLKQMSGNPKIGGKGRAIFGIVLGSLGILVWGLFIAIWIVTGFK